MFSLSTFLFIISSSHVLCTELCKSSDWWYDIESAKCRRCKTCAEQDLVLKPCSEFTDTFCVDLVKIGRFIQRTSEGYIPVDGNRTDGYPWHVLDDESLNHDPPPVVRMMTVTNAAVSKSVFDDFQSNWGHIVMVAICIAAFCVFGSIMIIIIRITGRRRHENRKNVARARLFSRDRLNTTEYMNNLATLDRRLAMDEILEKRKKAIFEPHLLQENVYTDEVFVDISGLPRNLQDDNDYEELDHSRCLLQMRDQQ